MKSINNLDDVKYVLKEIEDFISAFQTSNTDLKGHRIINAGPSIDNNDYIIRRELENEIVRINNELNEIKLVLTRLDVRLRQLE